jgi:hypothetical protein
MPVKQEKYSVKIQMILSVIPFVNLWAAYRIKKLQLCLVIQLSFGLLVALWYFVETPGSPKVDVRIIIIELVTSPVRMRYFTIKSNE